MGQATIDFRDISTGHLAGGGPIPSGPTRETAPYLDSETFLFWNPPGGPLTKDRTITMTLSPGSIATAWYGKGGPGKIVTVAFSDGENKLLPQTPIASVVPASAWSGGNSEDVSNSTSVTITAKDSIAGDSGETFDGWLQFEEGVVSGATLTVPAGKPCFAIASYRNPKVKIPKTNRSGLVYVRILAGIEGGGDGIYQTPDGRIHYFRPDPEPWGTRAERDLLLGLALNEIGSLVNNPAVRSTIQGLGVELAQNALTRLNAEEPEK